MLEKSQGDGPGQAAHLGTLSFAEGEVPHFPNEMDQDQQQARVGTVGFGGIRSTQCGWRTGSMKELPGDMEGVGDPKA